MGSLTQTKQTVAEVIENFEKNPSFGPRYGDYDEERLLESFIEGASEEVVELAYDLMIEWEDENREDIDQHPKELFAEDNIRHVYVSQEPWRAPLFIVEVEEAHKAYHMPNLMPNVQARRFPIRTIPADSPDLETAEFQIRQGFNR